MKLKGKIKAGKTTLGTKYSFRVVEHWVNFNLLRIKKKFNCNSNMKDFVVDEVSHDIIHDTALNTNWLIQVVGTAGRDRQNEQFYSFLTLRSGTTVLVRTSTVAIGF